jgi:hypothetical protein
MFAAESTKASHLEVELAECGSTYANLEAAAAEAKHLHRETLSAVEAE